MSLVLNYRENDPSVNIQRYPQRMRLQRRLYRIYTGCFLLFMIPSNCKLVLFLCPLIELNTKTLFKEFPWSSLQSHLL